MWKSQSCRSDRGSGGRSIQLSRHIICSQSSHATCATLLPYIVRLHTEYAQSDPSQMTMTSNKTSPRGTLSNRLPDISYFRATTSAFQGPLCDHEKSVESGAIICCCSGGINTSPLKS